jgi:hypothetical protein
MSARRQSFTVPVAGPEREALMNRICGGRATREELDAWQAEVAARESAQRQIVGAAIAEHRRKEKLARAFHDKPHTMTGQLLLFRLTSGDAVVGTMHSYFAGVYTMKDVLVEFSGVERRMRMAEMQVYERHVTLMCVDQRACRYFVGGRDAAAS